ncbi:MAG: methyltransferase domain-containing protein [Gammaproteobacteria bacterium]|nr:MAG: methyltransferase domain-containing protein [Gammaproteobacteria bacterium]
MPKKIDSMSAREKYTLGYGDRSMEWMTRRTAEGHGAFMLPYLEPGMRFLDCGCGPGTLTLGFAAHVAPGETIGIDLEASQFTDSMEAARRDGITNLSFQTGDIYALPFDDESFDAMFGSAVLGSLGNAAAVVGEMVRVLKPGGVIGLKEFDHGGDIIWPLTPAIERSIELYHRLRAHNGHEQLAGRRLKGWLDSAGCSIELVHASYAERTDVERIREIVGRNNDLSFEVLAAQYEALGWCTREDLEVEAQAWIEFAENPAAVYLSTWFEVVGRK